ncbi:MAG: ATP-binding protein [Acidobacteriota bacterium]
MVAVVIAATWGGYGAGFTAIAASIAVVVGLFRGEFILPLAQSGITVFVGAGLLASAVIGRTHRANRELVKVKENLERANDLLSQQSAALSHSNAELQHIAYGLAHDLSSPLRGVRTYAQMLMERHREDPETLKLARTVDDSGKRMEALITALLSYASVAQQNSSPSVDSVAIVRNVLQDYQDLIVSLNAKIEVSDLPKVRVSEANLAQLFGNLIGNALKYRDTAAPRITIAAQKDGEFARFSIRDNGIGFDMRYHGEIFAIFKRLHGPQRYLGSGIGLAICKAVVEREGGRIWAESAPGNGSTFYFTLPASPAPQV